MPPENRRRSKVQTEPDTAGWSEEDKAKHRREKALQTPVADMAIPVRIVNILEDNGVLLCADLMNQTYKGLMGMQNFGDKTLREVRRAIRALGLAAPRWRKTR